ncbi:MAG: hypothetical protein DCC55_15035 [Chloroflexi bacterium]|nr:MAG: hypothetical protein DCC55_15035 [Chloroflexota bacterium]
MDRFFWTGFWDGQAGRNVLALAIGLLLLAGCSRPAQTPPRRGDAESRAPLVVQVGEAESDQALIDYGAALYEVNCAACHHSNGEGNLNRFPALNGSALVTAQQPQPLIRTVLYGRGVMPAFAPRLSDQEVAAVLSYIRNAWSNSASVVPATQVSEVRAATTPTPDVTGSRTGSDHRDPNVVQPSEWAGQTADRFE